MSPYNPLISAGQIYRQLSHIRKFNEAAANPRKAQEEKLLSITRANSDTAFGLKHGFKQIKSIRDFQAQVEAASYESLEPYIDASMEGKPAQLSAEKPLMYATTSGTTGKPKFIPITPSHLRDYTHAFHVHNWGLIKDNPEAAHHKNGKYLILTSNDREGYSKDGTPYGAVSGLLRRRQSPLIQRYIALPSAISQIKNVESKYYSILRLALAQDIVSVSSCNPSTLLLLADQMQIHAESLLKDIFEGGINSAFSPEPELMQELAPFLKADRNAARALHMILEKDGVLLPYKVWPNLKVMSVWKGGPMQFYLQKLPEKYGQMGIRDFGYMASEGRGTIPLTNEGAGGVAAVSSHFFEFVPEEDEGSQKKRYLILDELEAGKRYFIHFTTAAGLYRYNINDLMEVVGFYKRTPVLQFVQKGMGISSITGEKLTEEQVGVALDYAIRQHSLDSVEHFIMAVKLADTPYYTGYVESSRELADSLLSASARTIDLSLQLQNIEYRDKRLSKRLAEVRLELLPPGTFKRLRQMRVMKGAPEAQVKIPFLTNNTSFSQDIAKLAAGETAAVL